MNKIFIFGSCVSRDAFEFNEDKDLTISSYYARSSLASLIYPPNVHKKLVENIESNWQRRMVVSDMSKEVLDAVIEEDYQILLLDFIDERFHLCCYEGYCNTFSTEFKKAITRLHKKELFQYKLINRFSEEKFNMWKEGCDLLMKKMNSCGRDITIAVNKLYWADSVDESHEAITTHSKNMINEANKYLNKVYNYLANNHNVKFIEYPDSLLYTVTDHKWGPSPFHYSDKLYKYTIEKISSL